MGGDLRTGGTGKSAWGRGSENTEPHTLPPPCLASNPIQEPEPLHSCHSFITSTCATIGQKPQQRNMNSQWGGQPGDGVSGNQDNEGLSQIRENFSEWRRRI